MSRSIAGAVIAIAFFVAASPIVRAADCDSAPGGRVVLSSEAVDPEVFLWDSRLRLVNYSEGEWDSTRAIFAHTMLAEPGTLALVVSCVPGVAHPRFGSGDQDAVGVKVLSGAHKGRYGWVLSSDVRRPRGTGQGAAATAGENNRR